MPSGSSIILQALAEAGVKFVFANLGSDHTGFMEEFARAEGQDDRIPTLITCPTEMVAMSAAHGYAQVTGRAQAVLVHVDCGTQSLGGAVHNAARGRVPVFLFAGLSPATQHGERAGSRNEFIHWIQDTFDQRGLVRGYVKYEQEIRTAINAREIVLRAMRFAHSEPAGPVYLCAARETLEESVPDPPYVYGSCAPLGARALTDQDATNIAVDLAHAKLPLIVTSYVGRNPKAVEQLVRLSDRLGIGVIESVPSRMNFPHDHPMYLGSQWNEARQNPILAEADVVLVVDSDVPWIPLVNAPTPGARIYHIDVDPLKQQMPLAVISASHAFQADAAAALEQIRARIPAQAGEEPDRASIRARVARLHAERIRRLEACEQPSGNSITPEFLTACLRELVGPGAIVLSEGISNYSTICDHMQRTRPGSMYASGGGSLGWNGGAAIGAKLAKPNETVICLTGDGSYLFSAPSAVHWMARRYNSPFLQVIYNNGGWKSPKLSTLALHSDGYSTRSLDVGWKLAPEADYGGLAAAAGGSLALSVQSPDALSETLATALRVVQEERRTAVVDVKLPSF